MTAKGPPQPIPLTVLTGFLGAGKTTLLNRLLADPGLADTVVIVNEFGAVGLDHLLVESVEDGLVLLAAGCLCCTIRGDLVQTLEDLLRRRDNGRIAPFRRVVIETTGLADPAPVLSAVLYHPYLSRRYAISGLVTLVDALTGGATLSRHKEAYRQAAMADRLVLTKTDLTEPGAEAPLAAALRRLNPAAPILRAAVGEAGADLILDGGLFGTDGKVADVGTWLRAEEVAHSHPHGHVHSHGHDISRHGERIRSFVLTSDAPVPSGALDTFLDILRSTYGPKLLRIKGLVATTAEPDRPVLIHVVQHVLHVPAILPAWPDDDRRSRLVLIVEDVPAGAIERLWDAFVGRPAIDAPDGAALGDNPLAPPTLARGGPTAQPAAAREPISRRSSAVP